MKPEQAFNAALARFKTADAAVSKLAANLDEAKSRRVQAGIDSAVAHQAANDFASGVDFNPNAAADIATKRQNADAVLDLLDRGIDHLETELANAKINVIAAENDCVSAQASYHDSLLDESTHKWLRSNAKQLQSLCQQLHMATIFQRIQHDGQQPSYPPTHIENLFLLVLPRLVSNEFSDDEPFREGCQATLTGAPINRPSVSVHVSSRERSAIRNVHRRDQQVTALRKLMQPQDEPLLDRHITVQAMNYANDRVQRLRQSIEVINARIARGANQKQVEADKAEVQRLTELMQEDERKANNWNQQLSEHAA